jgi:hypothetical protein
MRQWIFPPALWTTARKFVHGDATNQALSPPEHPTPLSDIMFPPRPGPDFHWIAAERIVNRYGQSFSTEQHHFLRYLESGFEHFEAFYRIHQPKTALQLRFINQTLPDTTEAHNWDAPWAAPQTETGTRLHDPVCFGPVSKLELITEAARLDKVQHSIEKYGFLLGNVEQPGGQIAGRIFYKDNDDFRIVVYEGNHRVAVLHHLGWRLIPVHQLVGYHPVRLSDLEKWPGVVDGRYAPETAHAIFEAFFRPRHQQLLPGW